MKDKRCNNKSGKSAMDVIMRQKARRATKALTRQDGTLRSNNVCIINYMLSKH